MSRPADAPDPPDDDDQADDDRRGARAVVTANWSAP